MSIFPNSDLRCVSSLYVNTILVHDALTGTHGGITGISATFTSERHSSVTFENRSCKWNIGLETAKRTLQATTQHAIRTAIHLLHRRYCVDHLHHTRRRLNKDWFTVLYFLRSYQSKVTHTRKYLLTGHSPLSIPSIRKQKSRRR
jgi:hypothetical protein